MDIFHGRFRWMMAFSLVAPSLIRALSLPTTIRANRSFLPSSVVAFSSDARGKVCGGGSLVAGALLGRTTALSMVRSRGLEIPVEGATPLPGGMTLYIKAGPDGTSPGDCPFAHFVRMVLHEKDLEYDLRPSTADTKPQWLIDHYGGAMPALRHRKECYTESDVIAEYLDFFFQDNPLSAKRKPTVKAKGAIDGIFPAIAKYLKHTPDGDEEDGQLRANLEASLQKLEDHLAGNEGGGNTKGDSDVESEAGAAAAETPTRTGPYLVGDGETFTLLDCSLAPKLYHMDIGLTEFKSNAIDIARDFPAVRGYMDAVFSRESFNDAIYPKETVVWGWSNARA